MTELSPELAAYDLMFRIRLYRQCKLDALLLRERFAQSVERERAVWRPGQGRLRKQTKLRVDG